ncbi:MAG: hypothetical protein HUN04_01120 [Desulfobacter sp.]|nr:MAG: hypothetical protein HUN04_01120 [Desulfobacter sp.]
MIDSPPHVDKTVKIHLEFSDLVQKIQMKSPNPAILQAAESAFDKAKGKWQPAMALQWVGYSPGPGKENGTITLPDGTGIRIHPGHSARFLDQAGDALAAVYTAGSQIDELAAAASEAKDFMGAHFIDLIGLLVLEKTEALVKQQAEEQAARRGWGVSPFLSPGSVHGWALEEQVCLASFLPLSDIGVSMSGTGVFSPFKTISCLIGIGPGYKSRKVGSTCRVCSRREHCTIRHNQNTGQAS